MAESPRLDRPAPYRSLERASLRTKSEPAARRARCSSVEGEATEHPELLELPELSKAVPIMLKHPQAHPSPT